MLPNDLGAISRLIGFGGPVEMGGSQEYISRTNNTQAIQFDCDFECGNIDQVRQRDQSTFDLWMRNDTNGSNNLQWFYFRMLNPANFTKKRIRINIVNFTKGNSLFYFGMRPSFWSQKTWENSGRGWFQGGENVEYEISPYHGEINKMNQHKPKSYYALSFDFVFDYP